MAKQTINKVEAVESTMTILVELKFTTYNHTDYEQAIQAINDSIRGLKESGHNFKFKLNAEEEKW